MTISNPFCAVLLVGLTFCAACSTHEKPVFIQSGESGFFGCWEANIGFAKWIVVRKSDGTFEERRVQSYDYSRAPILFYSKGVWSVVKGEYTKRYTWTNSRRWQEAIGRDLKAKILVQSANEFIYRGEDTPEIIEKRIKGPNGSLRELPLALDRAYADFPIDESDQTGELP